MANGERTTEILVSTSFLLAIPCLFVILRCYVRACIVKALGWDDAAMILAMAFYIIFAAFVFEATSHGYGQTMAMLTPEQRVTIKRYFWGSLLLFEVAPSCCRLSICIFLLRLTVKPIQIRLIQIVMGLVAASFIMSIFGVLTNCKPINYAWLRLYEDPTITGQCYEEQTIYLTYVFSGLMALCDIALGILPIFMACRLQMAWRMKAAISCILGLAGAASAAVITRTVYLAQAHKDPEYFAGTVPFLIWSNVETSIGIIAGCLATLGPLLRHFRLFSDNSDPARTPTPRPGVLVRYRGIRDLLYPLSSFRSSRLRSDKLLTIMTEI
ncbi:hypothetical protein BJX62DRAFT_242018 [Aspergillus germanicus]